MRNDLYIGWIVLVVFSYLLGSCLFSQWLPMLLRKKDIASISDDHCPGSANVFTHCGWQLGLVCLTLDMAKGFLPVFLGLHYAGWQSYLFSFLMLAPVLGHAWSIFFRFRGGKCIATIFGELLALLRITPSFFILAVLFILFSTVIKISPNNRRSILVFSLFAIIAFCLELFFGRDEVGAGCLLISVIAIVKHLPPHKPKLQEAENRSAILAEGPVS